MAMQPVRFFVISDTHDMELTDDPSKAFRSTSTSSAVDVVLHCGDLTENGGLESYHKAINLLDGLKAELKLVIAGNHETDLDSTFWAQQGGSMAEHKAALDYLSSDELKARGIHFLFEGTRTFTLKSGAKFTVYASPYTPKHGLSAFQYPPAEDRYNPDTPAAYATNASTSQSIIPDNIDIVMTHGPPKYLLDRTVDGGSGGCEHLRRAICRSRPLLHCFGHIHGAYGAQRVAWRASEDQESDCFGGAEEDEDGEMIILPKDFVGANGARKRGYARLSPACEGQLVKGKQTLLLNAAIENSDGAPENAPWLVELHLPCAGDERRRGTVRRRDSDFEGERSCKRSRKL